MAVTRDRPYLGNHFLVDLGLDDPRAVGAGFSEVVFPTFAVVDKPDASIPTPERLVLRRGVTGALDLHAWWAKGKRGKAPQRRTARIDLLGDDGESVVMSWRFRNVRPVALSYSPLRALEAAVLIETIELEFDSMEVL
ncbi:MAG: phage tail protein [Luteibacter sp.]